MTIVADENIPFAERAFGTFGNVRLLPGRRITRDDLRDADALVVRSVTRVDASLLADTPVRFVGTATIGVDHIDIDYLLRSSISFADATGSNARSVAEYVVAALLELHRREVLNIEDGSLGVVGAGHVGSIVAEMARELGMQVVEHDPPRAAREESFASAGLDEVVKCDAITLHVPLTDSGDYPTRHLIDEALLQRMPEGRVLLNTSRGGVVRSDALLTGLRSGHVKAAVLDVWEEEPDIPTELIGHCTMATPHIAGYSFDGKVRGTEMVAAALADFAGEEERWEGSDGLPRRVGELTLPSDLPPLDAVRYAVCEAYDIMQDDAALRLLLDRNTAERRAGFDALRRSYRRRREFPAYSVITDEARLSSILSALGFTLSAGTVRS